MCADFAAARDRVTCRSRFVPAYEASPYPSGGGPHNGNLADFIWLMAFGAASLLAIAFYLRIPYLAASLFMMVVYLWSKRNPEAQSSFWMFQMKAMYLPWVMLGFSFIVGDDVMRDLLGILVGHVYYILQEVLPTAESPLKGYRLLQTPNWLYRFLQLPPTTAAAAYQHMRMGGGPAAPPPAAPQGRVWGRGVQLGR